jgi:hypothetical protein
VPTHLANQKVVLAENGLSAVVSAEISVDKGKAGRVWVAVVAYDVQGEVVGVRRWEKTGASPLEHGQALEMTASVYSVSKRIERVELIAESRP